MKIDLEKQELIIILNLLSQARFTIAESQVVQKLFNKLNTSFQNFKE